MDITYKKDGAHSFVILKNVDVDESSYKWKMLLSNHIDRLLQPTLSKINGETNIQYDASGMVSMESAFLAGKMRGDDIYAFVRGLEDLSEKLNEYLLLLDDVIFDMSCVYINRVNGRYQFCYCPGKADGFQKGIKNLCDRMLEYIDHDDMQAVEMGYGMRQVILTDGFTAEDMANFARKKRAEWKKTTNPKEPAEEGEPKENELKENEQAFDLKKDASWKINNEKEAKVNNKDQAGGLFKKMAYMFKNGKEYQTEEEMDKTEKNAEKFQNQSSPTTKGIVLKSTRENPQVKIQPERFPFTIGKSEKLCDCALYSPVISRVHMRIVRLNGGYGIEDMDSKNGTYINGERLESGQIKTLQGGDEVRMADETFVVEENI